MGNYLTTNVLTPTGSKLLAKDSSGNRGIILFKNGERRKLLVIGNSIAAQSTVSTYSLTATMGSIAAISLAGSLTITLTAGNVAALGLAGGSVIIYTDAAFGLHVGTVDSINGEILTLTKRIPVQTNIGGIVVVQTTPGSFIPAINYAKLGYIRAINNLLGSPLDLITPGYGFGGKKSPDICHVLPYALAKHRPDVVFIHPFDNDIASTTPVLSSAQSIALGRRMLNLCLSYGCIPIIAAPLPQNYTAGAQVQKYDDLVAWVNGVSSAIPGSIGVDPGNLYLDTSNGTYPRTYLADWTGGDVHPLAKRQYQIAQSIILSVSQAFGSSNIWQNLYSNNPLLTGTGGTGTNLQAGSAVPAGTTVAASSVSVCTTTKDANDVFTVDFAIAGASLASNVFYIADSLTVPSALVDSQLYKGLARLAITEHKKIDYITLYVADNSSGRILAYYSTTGDMLVDGVLDGEDIVIETPAFVNYPGVTTFQLLLKVIPQALSSPSGVVFKAKIYSMGIVGVSDGNDPNS